MVQRGRVIQPAGSPSVLLPNSRCHRGNRALRPTYLGSAIVFLLAASEPATAYSVLTHEQLIDLSWTATIVPVLLTRFPSLTSAQLTRAHSYAYGGCVIQDLGYYPFGNELFSDLTHYVRSGDFVRSLFRNARTADELAFAVGALAHYVGDTAGHSRAVNPAVGVTFPKLRAKYGAIVNYAQAPYAHGQVEFAFDVNRLAKDDLPPAAYLRFIGLQVPRRQLAVAFHETYGLEIGDILGLYGSAMRTYRFGVRTFLPALAQAEVLLHRHKFPPETPGPQLAVYKRRLADLHTEAEWHQYRAKPGLGTYLLAGLIIVLPKIGPIRMLAIKRPTVATDEQYIESVNLSTKSLNFVLAHIADSQAHALDLPASVVPNRDLDTGAAVVPGGYPLTDETYAKLLSRVTENPTRPIPLGLKEDISRYYANPSAPFATKKNKERWAQVQQELKLLTAVPTRAEPR
jgi:hypothetical protein